jgi:hypothetical protein
MAAPTPAMVAWLKRLAEDAPVRPETTAEQSAAYDCKKAGLSIFVMHHLKTGQRLAYWAWREATEDDNLKRYEDWKHVGEELTEKGWTAVMEYGED